MSDVRGSRVGSATVPLEIRHHIGGRRVADAARYADVFDPSAGVVQARLGLGTAATVDAAVEAASRAQRTWATVNPQRRARVLNAFRTLVEQNIEELAQLLAGEHGKVVADAKGEIQRGLEVIEFATGIPHLLKGDYSDSVGSGIDAYSMRQPLGVVAGITPFNFPAMIPMWMFGPAIACGNAFILKPSEKDPSVPVRLAELMIEAGGPPGVLNVVHGDKEVVDALLAHPAIQAISFVGSSDIAQYVYATAAANGKRVQAMGGAKNHGIVMPDADLDQVARDVIAAAYGSAGERCMAMPVIVPVGEATADALLAKMVPQIVSLRVGASGDPSAQYGPLVTAAHKARVESYIAMAQQEGARLVVDGRGYRLASHPEGFFLGPTLIDRVQPTMRSYRDEIFGPVLQIMRAASFEDALALASSHQYGNGVAIFTRSGRMAREFAARVDVGMVGVNVPIPVPLAYYTFGGWKRSAFGDLNQHGPEGVRFYTKLKTVTARWPQQDLADQGFVMPTMR